MGLRRVIGRRCHCGCRARLDDCNVRSHAKYASRACKTRAWRSRRPEASPSHTQSQITLVGCKTQPTEPHIYAYASVPVPAVEVRSSFGTTTQHQKDQPGRESFYLADDETFGDEPDFKGSQMDECENCNELGAKLQRTSTDVEALKNQNMANLRVIGQLRQSLAEHIEGEPEGDDIKRLLLLWRDIHFDDSERSKVNVRLDGPRALRVRWALKRYKNERVENAIRGAFHDDWAMGRDQRTRGRRYNDIAKHILKDEESIERFERLAQGKPAGDPHAGDIDKFVALLEGATQTRPGQWEARCPAHEDRITSLSVGQGRKGIVVHCHAGCSESEVAGAVGWPVSKLFAPEPVAVPPRPVDPLPLDTDLVSLTERLAGNQRLLARVYELRRWNVPELRALGIGFDGERLTFPVRDAEGNLVNVLRYKPGERQKAERKMLASRGRPRDLFPQPELYRTDPLWLVEGEPDAVTGVGLDLSCVAVPGASAWRPEWGERMRDRTVYVCFDCDQPGRQHAARVALALAQVAFEVRVVDLDPERQDGFDLSDFFYERGTLELLNLLAEKAGVVRSHRPAKERAA